VTKLDGRVAIVTGGSRGIGRAIGRTLALNGAKVILAARTRDTLEATRDALRAEGLSVDSIPTDVTLEGELENLIETTVRRYEKLDILVNNAGMGVFKPVLELTPEEFDTMWMTNIRGAYLATRAALPRMIASGGGDIVFISSLAGKNSFKGGAGYCATKWAMKGFASSLMLEVRDHQIRVVTIFPGSVDTAFSRSGKRGASITQPEDVADAVLFAVSSPARSMFSEIDVRPTRPS
jgi:3-oxoacyl-[acyl-carrier protein] reductase